MRRALLRARSPRRLGRSAALRLAVSVAAAVRLFGPTDAFLRGEECVPPPCEVPGLDLSYTGVTSSGTLVNLHYRLCGPTDCPQHEGDGLLPSDAPYMVSNAVLALEFFLARGFAPPLTTVATGAGDPVIEVFAFNRGAAGTTYPECTALDAPAFRDAPSTAVTRAKTRSVFAHELFHKIQYGHVAGMEFSEELAATGYCAPSSPGLFGTWVAEGQATLLGERWDAELDGHDATDYYAFMSTYLAGQLGTPRTDVPLTEVSYNASLFWSYACEQMGSIQTPPVRGADLIRTFWETARSRNELNPQWNYTDAADSIAILDAVIASRGRGSMAELYHDFAIACYAHELDRSSILESLPDGARYRFGEADQYVDLPGLFDYPLGLPRVLRRCYCLASSGCATEREFLAPTDVFGEFQVAVGSEPCAALQLPGTLVPSPAACAAADAEDFAALEGCERTRVRPFTADFHQIDVADLFRDPCASVDLRAAACADVGWALVGVGPVVDAATGRRAALFLRKGRGKTFSQTVVPRPGLERVALIVAGLEEESLYDVRIDRAQPRLEVLHPTSTSRAFAGPPSTPDRLLIRATLSGVIDQTLSSSVCPEGNEPTRRATSLDPADLQVEILQSGTAVGEGVVLAIDRFAEEYWIDVAAPPAPSAGIYDLRLRVGRGCAETEHVSGASVVYGAEVLNHVVVLDRSGSMGSPAEGSKLEAAKLAAGLYLDAAGLGDRIAVVAFDGGTPAVADCVSNADLLHPLSAAGESERAAARAAVSGITSGGQTSMGDGLWLAQDVLDGAAGAADRHAMLLLSDGVENEERFLYAAVSCPGGSVLEPALPRIETSAAVLSAIALGPETSQETLMALSAATGGVYQYVDVGSLGGAGAGSGAGEPAIPISSLGMPNRLALAFLDSLAHARRLERIDLVTAELGTGTFTIPILVDAPPRSLARGVFFFHWDRPGAIAFLDLTDPSGARVEAGRATVFVTGNHVVLHVGDRDVMPGSWTARLRVAEAPGTVEVVGGLLARDTRGLRAELRATQRRPASLGEDVPATLFVQGVPVTIRCVLADLWGPVRGATIEVTVERPDGSTTAGACGTLVLRDDGTQDDGAPDDGVYGLVYTRTGLGSDGGVDADLRDPREPIAGTRGSYIVRGTARGIANDGSPMSRSVELHFQVFDALKDHDGDGLPTGWEVHYGTDPFANDRLLDPDGDELNNLGELENGTDPRDPDTDGDGEQDGTELRGGRCPTIRGDQALPAPRDVEVVAAPGHTPPTGPPPGGVLLRFPWNGAYLSMRIERAPSRSGPFAEVANLSRGAHPEPLWVDTGVPPGATRFYRVQAEGAGGARSRRSPVVSGRALGDPLPPAGSILIQNGWRSSDRLDVRVRAVGAPTATHYRASHLPLRGDEPVGRLTAGEFRFAFPPPRRDPVIQALWVQLLNSDGAGSDELVAQVRLDLSGDADRDRIPNDRDPDDDNDGLSDEAELDRTRTDPFDPDTDGDGRLDGDDPAPLDPTAPAGRFRRGDANADGAVDISDAQRTLGYLFLGSPPPPCLKAADSADDGLVSISGAIYLLNHLFLGGPEPPRPGTDCGADPTEDPLSCASYPPCE